MFNIDYEFKAKVLSSGICQVEKKVSKVLFCKSVFSEDFKMAQNINFWYLKNYPKEWREASKINHSTYQRVRRLKDKITTLLKKPCLFLTLTFKPLILSSTSTETRRKYVTRFLKQFNTEYVGNIDFGKKNGREHYHAVIQIDKIDYSLWTYGAINGLKVRLDENSSSERLAKYVAKLTNHAIKETTKRSTLIYSRLKNIG